MKAFIQSRCPFIVNHLRKVSMSNETTHDDEHITLIDILKYPEPSSPSQEKQDKRRSFHRSSTKKRNKTR